MIKAQNPNKNNENFQNIQKNDGQNLRDLELFVLQERMEIQSQEEEKTRLNGILKKQMDKLKDYQNKLFSIDLKF